MEYTTLGKTGLKISRMGFGGIPIQKVTVQDVRVLMEAMADKGVNYIDTARGYTVSEQYIGAALEVMREIEAACGLAFTDIVNNSNLGAETTPETVYSSLAFAEELSRLSGLPVWLTTAEETVAQKLALPNVFPLRLQAKYFDLPSQKPAARPLWG